MRLAAQIVTWFYSAEEAEQAHQGFEKFLVKGKSQRTLLNTGFRNLLRRILWIFFENEIGCF